MDSVSLQRFNHILQKPIETLTDDEISFLKARRGELNAIQLSFYAAILQPKVEAKTEEPKEEQKKTIKK